MRHFYRKNFLVAADGRSPRPRQELSGKIIIATDNTTFLTNTGHIRVLRIASRNSSVARWVTRQFTEAKTTSILESTEEIFKWIKAKL